MPVRVVTFDADDTLWDFQGVAAEANRLIIDRLRSEHHGFTGTTADLAVIHHRVLAESSPGTPFSVMRRTAIARFVEEWVGPADGLAEELGDFFYAYRHEGLTLFPDVEPMLEALGDGVVMGVITNGNIIWEATTIADRFEFWLAADQIGIRKPDPRIFRLAAAAADARPRELVHVGDEGASDVVGAHAAGARAVLLNRSGAAANTHNADAVIETLVELPALVDEWNRLEALEVGVGPHPQPWPDDDRLDPALLAEGDRRNVVDRFRYWKREAIVAELDKSRHPFHVAIENWRHDLNIGTIVRTANAFGARAVHIVGKRRWNRRGAMVTDRYQHIHHHKTIAEFLEWARAEGVAVVGVDNLPGAEPLESASIPVESVFLFGQEGEGLSADARQSLDRILSIAQFGSTRSINAGVAAGIAMHAWIRQHVST